MPQTTRVNKMAGLGLGQAKLVADHRKKTIYPGVVETQRSVDSTMMTGSEAHRNIS